MLQGRDGEHWSVCINLVDRDILSAKVGLRRVFEGLQLPLIVICSIDDQVMMRGDCLERDYELKLYRMNRANAAMNK